MVNFAFNRRNNLLLGCISNFLSIKKLQKWHNLLWYVAVLTDK